MSFENIDQSTIILLAAASALIIALLLGVLLVARTRNRLQQRMTRINQRYTGKVVETAQRVSMKRKTSLSSIEGLDKVLQKVLPRPAAMRERLERTGRSFGVGEYLLANIAIAGGAAFAIQHFIGIGWAPAILAGLAIGLGLPHIVIGIMIKRRIKRFNDQFPDAIDLIVRGLKSGLPVQEGIKVVANEVQDPVKKEFQEISDAVKLGTTLEDAMWDASRRLDTPEFKFFVIAMSIQRETGGNLAETLDNLSDILRKRRQMRLKVKAMSGEARASALIIGALPFVMFSVLMMINPGYVGQLFEDNRGIVAVAIGLTWMTTGYAVMAKMIRFEI